MVIPANTGMALMPNCGWLINGFLERMNMNEQFLFLILFFFFFILQRLFPLLFGLFSSARSRLIKGEKENAADDGERCKKRKKKELQEGKRLCKLRSFCAVINGSHQRANDFHTIERFHIKPYTFSCSIIKIARENDNDRFSGEKCQIMFDFF